MPNPASGDLGTRLRDLPPILRAGRSEAEYQAARGSIAERLPLGRLGQPEEVAACADFLLSERAAYINGQIIHPNGGQQTW